MLISGFIADLATEIAATRTAPTLADLAAYALAEWKRRDETFRGDLDYLKTSPWAKKNNWIATVKESLVAAEDAYRALTDAEIAAGDYSRVGDLWPYEDANDLLGRDAWSV